MPEPDVTEATVNKHFDPSVAHARKLRHSDERRTIPWQVVLALAGAAGAVLAAHYLTRGWVPHDAGSLAQSAERVLHGELPHRDFDEIYTGGLSMLNALAFRVLGPSIVTLRLVLFAVFLAWIPAMYYVASRYVGTVAAGLVVLASVAWSLPNYFAAIPSWYNLFFAVFGTAALLRHMETGRRRYLVLAGLAGGLSFLAKIAGLYFIAAGVLFLVYREHCLARAESPGDPARAYRGTLTAGLVVFIALLARLIGIHAGAEGIITFVLPGGTVAAWLIWRLWTEPTADASGARFARAVRLVVPFLAGAMLPIIVFLLPYAASGSLGALWNGVFVLPAKRLTFASMQLPPLDTMGWSLVPGALLWASARWNTGKARVWLTTTLTIVLIWVLAHGHAVRVYRHVWFATRPLIPLTVCAGVALLALRGDWIDSDRRQKLLLMLAVAALGSLVQFPFAAPVYFCYVAPLGVLAAAAVAFAWSKGTRYAGAPLLCAYLLFAVLWVNTGFIYGMGLNFARDTQTHALGLRRAGIRVNTSDKTVYESAIALVRAHERGPYIWAGPDTPEIYFLAEKRNPTRTLFDFFDEPGDRARRVLEAIETHDVHVVVLNTAPPFSGPLPAGLKAALVERFPHSETAGGGWLQVRWRE